MVREVARACPSEPLPLLRLLHTALACCLLCKAAATVATYPLQIAQSLVYKTGKSTVTCVGEVIQARGFFGIWWVAQR